MNLSKKLPLVITIVLIGLSLFGVFEEKAFQFVSEVYKKNLSFLALTTELKVMVAGISSIKIPFVDGMTSDINGTIGKIQHYLLLTNVISFLQVILISISKSWILKVGTVVLFALSFVKNTKVLCTKLLLMTLALNPGLTLYSVAVQQISQEASIDFGDKYLQKLKTSVNAVKTEKAALMMQHASDITKINNGQKGIHILKRFRENVAYDFKKAKLDIKGEYTNIRLLIHEGGHEMMSKIFGFCSMILFTMILLPLGYALLIYILFNTLFKNNALQLAGGAEASLATDVKNATKSSFKSKLANIFKNYKKEFHSVTDKVQNSDVFQKVKSEAETVEGKVVSKVKSVANGEMDHLKSHITDEVSKIRGEVLGNIKSHITDEVSKIKSEVVGNVKSHITDEVSKIKGEVSDKIDQVKTNVAQDIDTVKTKVKSKVSKKAASGKEPATKKEEDHSSNVLSI